MPSLGLVSDLLVCLIYFFTMMCQRLLDDPELSKNSIHPKSFQPFSGTRLSKCSSIIEHRRAVKIPSLHGSQSNTVALSLANAVVL